MYNLKQSYTIIKNKKNKTKTKKQSYSAQLQFANPQCLSDASLDTEFIPDSHLNLFQKQNKISDIVQFKKINCKLVIKGQKVSLL